VNEAYGFSFTPFVGWKDYIVKEVKHADDPNLFLATFIFGLPMKHSSIGVTFGGFFKIYVCTHDLWSRLSMEVLPLPGYLGENSRYVFLWEPSLDDLEELEPLRLPLSDEAMKSRFKAFEPRAKRHITP
jgi:hypothetical protein